jgi:hypothetical protein
LLDASTKPKTLDVHKISSDLQEDDLQKEHAEPDLCERKSVHNTSYIQMSIRNLQRTDPGHLPVPLFDILLLGLMQTALFASFV